jgi:N-acetyl-gamma-glutamyl-phosphate reductase
MVKVGIINVTGYIGMEIARLLYGHPEVELVSVTGRSAAGKRLGEFLPHLANIDLTIEAELGDVDIAFIALPHKESAEAGVKALERGIKVIDVSADFRLKDAAAYEKWYDFVHPGGAEPLQDQKGTPHREPRLLPHRRDPGAGPCHQRGLD